DMPHYEGQKGRLHAVQLWGEAKSGSNPTAKAYIDMREGLLGNLSRSIAAERGVLTNQDIDRISRLIARIGANPLSSDNKEEADKKWAEIDKIMRNAESRLDQKKGMSTGKMPGAKKNDPLGIR
ncbi:MAG: hypothetical protein LUP94_02700, partial [Candidatus Methanomethylicus sp.]|nr:hypothetical protein [Candidatus Methanomethylicus sp.]